MKKSVKDLMKDIEANEVFTAAVSDLDPEEREKTLNLARSYVEIFDQLFSTLQKASEPEVLEEAKRIYATKR